MEPPPLLSVEPEREQPRRASDLRPLVPRPALGDDETRRDGEVARAVAQHPRVPGAGVDELDAGRLRDHVLRLLAVACDRVVEARDREHAVAEPPCLTHRALDRLRLRRWGEPAQEAPYKRRTTEVVEGDRERL